MDDAPALVNATVTCHTLGCGNAEVAITLPVSEVVVCGPCGELITDVVPTGA